MNYGRAGKGSKSMNKLYGVSQVRTIGETRTE